MAKRTTLKELRTTARVAYRAYMTHRTEMKEAHYVDCIRATEAAGKLVLLEPKPDPEGNRLRHIYAQAQQAVTAGGG